MFTQADFLSFGTMSSLAPPPAAVASSSSAASTAAASSRRLSLFDLLAELRLMIYKGDGTKAPARFFLYRLDMKSANLKSGIIPLTDFNPDL